MAHRVIDSGNKWVEW